MFFERSQCEGLQCLGSDCDLGQDIDAYWSCSTVRCNPQI